MLFNIPDIQLPKGPGRPLVYSPLVIVCCFIVMVAKKLSIRGLHRFLTSEEDGVAIMLRNLIPFPEGKVPSRRTLDRRLKQCLLSIQLYMLAATKLMIQKFKLGIARLALDNRMFEAFGAIWHAKDMKAGIIPDKLRNVDTTAGWGKSHYRGWVFGHGLEVFVTVGRLVFPILAFARSLRIKGNTAVKQFIHLLPKTKKGVISADSEYHDYELSSMAKQTGRSLHTPTKKEPEKIPTSKTYKQRKTTVEPFFEKFLLAFNARGKLDRKGPQAWPYLTICCLLYQLMVIYNLFNGSDNPLKVTHQICML